MAHVFISYAHIDGDFAELVKLELEKSGFEVWIDTERLSAGEDWREEIDEAIRESFSLILIMSPDSMKSPYVMYEWSFAWGSRKKIIPILFKGLPVEQQVHPRLDKRQYLDFTHRSRPLDKLIQRLRQIEIEAPLANHIASAFSSTDEAINIEIDYLLNILRTDPNGSERQRAVKGLGSLKSKKAVPTLMVAMHDRDISVCAGAAWALGEIRAEIAISGLIDALKGDFWESAAAALKKIGLPAMDALFNFLVEEDRDIAKTATRGLEKFGSSAIEKSLQLLNHEDSSVRHAVVKLLGLSRNNKVLEGLYTALVDEDDNVRAASAWALGHIQNKVAYPKLRDASYDKHNDVRGMVIWALGQIGEASALPRLIGELANTDTCQFRIYDYGQRSYAHTQRTLSDIAAEALKTIGTPEAIAALAIQQQAQDKKQT